MPELPEVETVMGGMRHSICNKLIDRVQVKRRDLRIPVNDDFAQRLTGKVIKSLKRRGKYIIMELEPDNLHIILHLGMSGRIRIFESSNNKDYEPRKHDHIIIRLKDGTIFAFEDPRRFGLMYIASEKDWRKEKPFISMGPEPLENWNAQDLLTKLKNKKANIKISLLDQRVVVGLGNIYVCEALYYAGISPLRSANTINEDEAERIVKISKEILEKAIKAGGSTLKDYQHTDGSLGYFQHNFAVYDKENKDCPKPSCKAKIKRITQGGRSSFYCPKCQR